MSTVILTPLFPPDPSPSALYTKLLAENLPSDSLSVIAFGDLPESVAGVTMYPISKRRNKLLRVLDCLSQLFRSQPQTLLIQNGPSVELPALIYSFLKKTTLIYIISDHAAQQDQSWLRSYVARSLQKKASVIISLPENQTIHLKPEWLPFAEVDQITQRAHDTWWTEHLRLLTKHAHG